MNREIIEEVWCRGGGEMAKGWWSSGGAEAISELGIQGLQESEFGEDASMHDTRREMWKKLAFVLIDFEKGCFNLLSLFHLSKMHVFVTCSSVSLKITTKITPGCKV